MKLIRPNLTLIRLFNSPVQFLHLHDNQINRSRVGVPTSSSISFLLMLLL